MTDTKPGTFTTFDSRPVINMTNYNPNEHDTTLKRLARIKAQETQIPARATQEELVAACHPKVLATQAAADSKARGRREKARASRGALRHEG